MNASRWQSPFSIWLGWLLVVAFLYFGPATFSNRLSSAILSGAGWSLTTLNELQEWSRKSVSVEKGTQATNVDAQQLRSLEQQNRDLAMMVASLREQNVLLNSFPAGPEFSETLPLRRTIAVSTNVIGSRGNESQGALRLLVSLGEREGIAENELVLDGVGLLVDQGALTGLSADQLVSLGKSLFGRTVQVGKWTTLVQPVTDPDFRTAVRLVRSSEFGTVMGARGILKGTGDGCEMIEVVGTEPVAVGDLVYTDTLVSPTSVPVYCGRVTNASIAANAAHWTIHVSPASSIESTPAKLTVLKTDLNLRAETPSP
ncbi:rod shape-determining protein MreC [Thalassoglobus sp.]|uniref:rod shape-determining protein MreC n=1 Tax=Thalassoglobus sp. TaxID=2795869 RepID=UPI003AA8A248